MHEIRISLRGEGVVLMGKNTMVRRALKGFVVENPEYERLLPFVRGKSKSHWKHNILQGSVTDVNFQATLVSSSPTVT